MSYIRSSPQLLEVSKMLIKPSSPTPQSLNRYNLSSSNQIMPSAYVSLAFFYTNPGHEISTIHQQIQNSISRTLSPYYPFGGRLVENDHIHCNDEGVEFREVRIHSPMYDILEQSRSCVFDIVFSTKTVADSEDSLVVVQLSHFDCGGMAIAVSISHKVADGSTLVTFIKDLATSTRLSFHVPAPLLVADSLFPRREALLSAPSVPCRNCVTRSFFFSAEKIEKLKLTAIESGIQQPSRVEVVTALLYQTAIGLSGPSVLISAINLRQLLALPQNAVGNIFSFLFCINEDDKMEFPELVGRLMEEKQNLKNLSKEKLSYESQLQELGERLKHLNSSKSDIYFCSSFCGFQIRSIDFGWGKPVWVSIFQPPIKDAIFLMDSAEDGIEALVTLEEEKMSVFEKNKELLSFASFDSPK